MAAAAVGPGRPQAHEAASLTAWGFQHSKLPSPPCAHSLLILYTFLWAVSLAVSAVPE